MGGGWCGLFVCLSVSLFLEHPAWLIGWLVGWSAFCGIVDGWADGFGVVRWDGYI